MKLKKYQRGTDSVTAKLTPKESVLNRNASELLGRDNIAALNAHGNMLAKRGVDLASDPTPGPSTENLLGYQIGTASVRRDDRSDLLKDADNAFYGGGQAPVPTPTPTPTPRYQSGTTNVMPSDEQDQGASMMQQGYRFTPQDLAEMQRQREVEGQSKRAQAMNEKPTFSFKKGTKMVPGYQYGTDDVTNPFGSGSANQNTTRAYMARYGSPDQRGRTTFPLPSGGSATVNGVGRFYNGQNDPMTGVPQQNFANVPFNMPGMSSGVQRSVQPIQSQYGGKSFSQSSGPMSHTQMAADIAKRNLTASGSLLGTQPTQLPQGVQQNISPEDAASKGLQWTGSTTGWQPYLSPQQMTDQNLQYTGGPSSFSNTNDPGQSTVHFLPPGFSTAVGSTGAQGSSPNDIHFLPPGFSSFQANTGPNAQLQFQPQQKIMDQAIPGSNVGYGSAYGY